MNLSSSIRVNKSGVFALAAIGIIIIVVYRSSFSSISSSKFGTEANFVNLKELLSAAIDAAQRGGDEVSLS